MIKKKGPFILTQDFEIVIKENIDLNKDTNEHNIVCKSKPKNTKNKKEKNRK